MGLDRELGFMKELTRLRLRISALEAALKAADELVLAYHDKYRHPSDPKCVTWGYVEGKKQAYDAARKECGL